MSARNDPADTEVAKTVLDLVDRRAEALAERLRNEPKADREPTTVLLGTVEARSAQLRQSLPISDNEQTTIVAVSLLKILDSLGEDIHTVSMPDDFPGVDRVERQLRSWLGTIDDLAVQAALGRMELHDEIVDLRSRAHGVWSEVVAGVAKSGSDSSRVVDDVREVLHDLRNTVRAAVNEATQ